MLNKRVLTIFNVLILVASFAVLVRAQDAPYRMNDKEVKKLMDDDPGVKAGIFTYEVHPCRGFPGDSLPG